MKKINPNNIYLSLTGTKQKEWKSKMEEINDLKIDTIALFVESYKRNQREKIYRALEESSVKKIPLIHIRNDMRKSELKYLCKKYNYPYLTIHEKAFDNLAKWRGYYKYLYLEMNNDNYVSKKADINKIGGFCVDLSHFKKSEECWSKDFLYTLKNKNKKIFHCNHINGYSYKENQDVHTVTSLKQFDYLKTLPDFLFSRTIAIETYNSIKEQIKFKKHILKILNK